MASDHSMVGVISFVMHLLSLLFIPFSSGITDLASLTPENSFFQQYVTGMVMIGIFFGFLWTIAVYEIGNWKQPVPASWFVISGLVNIVEVILVPQMFNVLLHVQIGWFMLLPWVCTLLAPFIAYLIINEHFAKESKKIADDEILSLAKKYGGILTQSVIVWEKKTTLEEAKKSLERFVKHGEAEKKKIGFLTIFDFPSARVYLNKIENLIVEIMRDNPYGMSKSQLMQLTRLSLDSLNEALKRLESLGIICYDIENDVYRLRGVTPISK